MASQKCTPSVVVHIINAENTVANTGTVHNCCELKETNVAGNETVSFAMDASSSCKLQSASCMSLRSTFELHFVGSTATAVDASRRHTVVQFFVASTISR